MTSFCSRCDSTKPSSEFYLDKTKGLSSYCKTCTSQYQIQRWQERKVKAVAHKGGKCEDCGGDFHPAVFDFHHLDPSHKEMAWRKMRLTSWKNIIQELDKCVLLCANCHRLRHAEER